MMEKNRKTIQSVDRAINILRCFNDNEELGVTEISKIMMLHKSTIFGLISTLEVNGLLEKNSDTGKYRLGIELFKLGCKVNLNLRRISIPYLEKIVKIYHETVNLVILNDDSVVYLEKIEGTRSMSISTLVGGKLPLYCTAVGKAILAGIPQNELIEKVEEISFKKFTNNTIDNKELLLKCIDNVKKVGYAEEFEEFQVGLTCIAAPIYNYIGNAFAAISISMPTSRANEILKKEISKTLIDITQEISRKIGYTRKYE